ncbi:MAG: hypothetical protein Q4G43_10425 [Mobilicoccus sp.]|nr:hypothetical protein [Mobilicoccus sp.]
MRITLNVDDDVLQAIRTRATAEGRTAGQVLSDLARAALTRPATPTRYRNGLPLLAAGGVPVTNALIDRLRD